MHKLRVWDLPTRLFHWLLPVLVLGLWYTGTQGSLMLEWHFYLGYALIALIVFRLLWGIVGSRSARFSDFLYGPKTVWHYVRHWRRPQTAYLGHNPIGGWMTVVMLVMLAATAITGLFANDDIFMSGPLASEVSYATQREMTGLHKWLFDGLLVLISLHVLAIVVYWLVRRENLLTPMITGRKQINSPKESDEIRFASLTLAAVLLAICGLAVWWVFVYWF